MNANILVETEGLSREEWLKWRKRGIGGSDVSCLLGINKWKSEIELWLEKSNQTNEQLVENEAMIWGTIMEPVIRKYFSEVTGKMKNNLPTGKFIACTDTMSLANNLLNTRLMIGKTTVSKEPLLSEAVAS